MGGKFGSSGSHHLSSLNKRTSDHKGHKDVKRKSGHTSSSSRHHSHRGDPGSGLDRSLLASEADKPSPAVDPDWENWDEKNLDYDDEIMLEKKRQLLQRELAKQSEFQEDSVDNVTEGKRKLKDLSGQSGVRAAKKARTSQVHESTSSSAEASSDSDSSHSTSTSSSSSSSGKRYCLSTSRNVFLLNFNSICLVIQQAVLVTAVVITILAHVVRPSPLFKISQNKINFM